MKCEKHGSLHEEITGCRQIILYGTWTIAGITWPQKLPSAGSAASVKNYLEHTMHDRSPRLEVTKTSGVPREVSTLTMLG